MFKHMNVKKKKKKSFLKSVFLEGYERERRGSLTTMSEFMEIYPNLIIHDILLAHLFLRRRSQECRRPRKDSIPKGRLRVCSLVFGRSRIDLSSGSWRGLLDLILAQICGRRHCRISFDVF
jgi:hypothetical protein